MTDITANEYRTAAKVCAAEEDWSRAKALRELADLIDANDARDAEREARHLASKLAHDAEITALAIIQMEGESGWWRGVECDKFADRTYESMTGDNQQAIRSGVSAVLAHLQSTGRLIPAGGMALTAEQVEDVRTVLGKATTEYGAMELTAAWARLRVLFPATEPAEEETKARCLSEIEGWVCSLTTGHDGDHTAYDQDGPAHIWPTSSPVVPAPNETGPRYCSSCKLNVPPAPYCTNCGGDTIPRSPTETGPWKTCGHVPIGIVFRSKDRHPTFTWVNEGGSLLSVRNECEDGYFSDGEHCLPSMVDENFAPFVAAEEG